jgi:3-oxoacyl-[acyl-carrier protein] reductase
MTALVTGAASPIGIGRATALRLASAGEDVALVDIDGARLEQTRTEIARLGVRVVALTCDVADNAAVDLAAAAAVRELGPVTTLVANVGIIRRAPFEDQSEELWSAVLETNLGGARRFARALLPSMRSAGGGAMVFLSSHMGSARSWAERVPYGVSKAAIEGLARGLALELAPAGIRVNAVAPGFVRTEQLLDPINSSGEAGARLLAESVPLGRLGRPEDIAELIAFLASPAAGYITGQTILIDGGVNLE